MGLWVVKIGGSLHDSPCLPRVVRRVSDLRHTIVVVPGGGGFADQVRSSQKRWRFDDRCAHTMALLAMRQYGYLLASLGSLETTTDAGSLSDGIGSRVWLPDEVALHKELAPSWDVTSDSVSAWLACKLKADWLVLIKPVSQDAVNTPTELVDAAFAGIPGQCAASGKPDVPCAIVDAGQWLSEDFSCEDYRWVID